MEILIAAFISILTQFLKWVAGKFGKEATKGYAVAFLIFFSGLFAYLKIGGYLAPELIREAVELLTMTVGIYELAYKRILKPIFEKLLL